MHQLNLDPNRLNKNGNKSKYKREGLLNIGCRNPPLINSVVPPCNTENVSKIKYVITRSMI